MLQDYETTIYTRRQVRNARAKGQIKGFAQGAVATVLVLLLLKILGWVPALLLLVAILAVGVGLVRRTRKSGD